MHPTGAAVRDFVAETNVSADGGTSAVADGAFSVPADAKEWTDGDNGLKWSFRLSGTVTGAQTSEGQVNIYGQRQDINATADAAQPTTSFGHEYIGSLPISNASATVNVKDEFSAKGVNGEKWLFFIEVDLPGATELAAGWVLNIASGTVTPQT